MKVAGIDVSSKTVTLIIHYDGRMGKPGSAPTTWLWPSTPARATTTCVPSSGAPWPASIHASTRLQREQKAPLSKAGNRYLRIAELQQSIDHLEVHIEHLRRQILDLVRAHENLQAIFNRLVSITSIAAASAIQLLGELLVLPEDMCAKQTAPTLVNERKPHTWL